MDEDEIMQDDSLTPDEEREVEEGKMDAEEAHRFDEFEEVRGILERIETSIEKVMTETAAIKESMSIFVENGAVVNDANDAIVIDAEDLPDELVPLEELDLTLGID